MARHAAPKAPTARRVLTVLATASVALGAAATTAAAAGSASPPGASGSRSGKLGGLGAQPGLDTATRTAGHVTDPVMDFKPNPFAGSRMNPLDNGAGTQVADFKPVNTRAVTGPVAKGDSIGGILPLGRITGARGA